MRLWLAVLVCVAVVVLPACGGGGDDDADDSGDDDNGSSSARPTRTPRPTATPDPDAAPTFAEGGWTGGEAKVTVSGAATASLTGPLIPKTSSTEGKPDYQTTRLAYGASPNTMRLSISTQYQPFAMDLFQAGVYVQSVESCEVTYKTAEEKRIEGTFKCTDVDVEQGATGEDSTTVEGTFLATR